MAAALKLKYRSVSGVKTKTVIRNSAANSTFGTDWSDSEHLMPLVNNFLALQTDSIIAGTNVTLTVTEDEDAYIDHTAITQHGGTDEWDSKDVLIIKFENEENETFNFQISNAASPPIAATVAAFASAAEGFSGENLTAKSAYMRSTSDTTIALS